MVYAGVSHHDMRCLENRGMKLRFPSYCNFYKEPLVRVKKSADGSAWLVIACNPYNVGVQKVSVRSEEGAMPMEFDLIGDYPAIKRFRANK